MRELRKQTRRQFHYPAQVDLGDGSPLRTCQLADVSQSGARLSIVSPESLPEQFALLLAREGGTRRWCVVAWRSEMQVGVRFVSGPPPRLQPIDAVTLDV